MVAQLPVEQPDAIDAEEVQPHPHDQQSGDRREDGQGLPERLPKPVAVAPRVTNTTPKPRTKHTAVASVRRYTTASR